MIRKTMVGLLAIMILGIGIVSASETGIHTMDHDFNSGKEYSEHVTMHAQTMGFTGDHNPGVHHNGYSHWVLENRGDIHE